MFLNEFRTISKTVLAKRGDRHPLPPPPAGATVCASHGILIMRHPFGRYMGGGGLPTHTSQKQIEFYLEFMFYYPITDSVRKCLTDVGLKSDELLICYR